MRMKISKCNTCHKYLDNNLLVHYYKKYKHLLKEEIKINKNFEHLKNYIINDNFNKYKENSIDTVKKDPISMKLITENANFNQNYNVLNEIEKYVIFHIY